MIDALIGGTLLATPVQCTGKTGKSYVAAKVRTPTASGESLFVRVASFDKTTCAALLALQAGEPVHLAGQLAPKVWTPEGGEPRVVLDLIASACLTTHDVNRKRKAVANRTTRPAYGKTESRT